MKKKYTDEDVVKLFEKRENCSPYTTTHQFLKENGLIKEEFEVGKWYLFSGEKRFLICIIENGRYGFDTNGIWFYNSNLHNTNRDEYKEATHEEVEEALIKEARKRGFKAGVNINQDVFNHDLIYGKNRLKEGCMNWTSKRLNFAGLWIFFNGKWAEIIEGKEEVTMEEVEKKFGYPVKIIK